VMTECIPLVTTKIPNVTTKIPNVTTKVPNVTTKVPIDAATAGDMPMYLRTWDNAEPPGLRPPPEPPPRTLMDHNTRIDTLAYFTGISTHCGLCITLLTTDDPLSPDLGLTDLFDGECSSRIFVQLRHDPGTMADFPNLYPNSGQRVKQISNPSMVLVDTCKPGDIPEFIGRRTWLVHGHQEEGIINYHTCIVERMEGQEFPHEKGCQSQCFCSKVTTIIHDSYNDTMTNEEIMDYGEMMDYINRSGEFLLVVHADIQESRSCCPYYNGLSYLSKVNGENLSMENAFLATVSCVDADLIHYPNTECSVTGCSLNFQNGIPGNWYSKMMSTVFVSTRTKACLSS